MKKILFSFAGAVFFSLTFVAPATASPATIAGFEMAGLAGTEVSFNATTNDANLQTVTVTRGAGINPSALLNAFSSTAFVVGGTKANAITNNEYFQVELESKNGRSLSLDSIALTLRRSGTGPNAYQWQYSLDGFATAGVDVGAQGAYSGTEANGSVMPAVDLSGVSALQNITSGQKVTFRLYAWGATNAGGTLAIGRLAGDDLAFVGTVELNKLAAFELAGQNGDQAVSSASYLDPNAASVGLSRGSGISPSFLLNAFSARSFAVGGTQTVALADQEYFEVRLDAARYHRLHLQEIKFNLRRSITGPTNYQWQYSLDGFATAGVDVGAEGYFTDTNDDGIAMPSIDLTAVLGLQGAKSVTFRLYAWGATGEPGTLAFGRLAGDDLVFSGLALPNVILAFDPQGLTGDQLTFADTARDADLNSSTLMRGAGIGPAFLLDAFSSNDFVVGGSKADAIAQNEYLQLEIQAMPGHNVSLGFIDSNLRRSGTGPNAYRWQYSLDGFATAGIDAGPDYSYTSSENDGTARPRVDLSGYAPLQSIMAGETLTLRLFAWGATGAPGTFAVGRLAGDDLAFVGEVDINSYTLSYSAAANGSLTGSSTQSVTHGSDGSPVTAVPDAGYHFVSWSDASTTNPRTDTDVTGDISVTANFAINSYSLDYSVGAHGTLIGSVSQSVDHGSDGSPIRVVTDYGYAFLGWSDGSPDNPRTDLNVTGNISVTANVEMNSQAQTGGGGDGSSGLVPHGYLTQGFTIDPVLVAAMTQLGYGAHELVKLPDDGNPDTQRDSTVYYLGIDGRRHAFPNDRVFFSWYCGFDGIRTIAESDLAKLPLGRNVSYRPGLRLVKFPSVPTVYLVQTGGILRAVADESMAVQLAGTDWNMRISDISEAFYQDYAIDGPLISPLFLRLLDQSPTTISGNLNFDGYSEPPLTGAQSCSPSADIKH